MDHPIPDSTLLHSDHLLKRMAIVAGAGIVVGIALYVALGLGVGA